MCTTTVLGIGVVRCPFEGLNFHVPLNGLSAASKLAENDSNTRSNRKKRIFHLVVLEVLRMWRFYMFFTRHRNGLSRACQASAVARHQSLQHTGVARPAHLET